MLEPTLELEFLHNRTLDFQRDLVHPGGSNQTSNAAIVLYWTFRGTTGHSHRFGDDDIRQD